MLGEMVKFNSPGEDSLESMPLLGSAIAAVVRWLV